MLMYFFRLNIFHSLRYEQNLLASKIAGKLMNIKKLKLLQNENSALSVEISVTITLSFKNVYLMTKIIKVLATKIPHHCAHFWNAF